MAFGHKTDPFSNLRVKCQIHKWFTVVKIKFTNILQCGSKKIWFTKCLKATSTETAHQVKERTSEKTTQWYWTRWPEAS